MNIISREGEELIDVDAAKANSRVTTSVEDALWPAWISTAHHHIEDLTGLVLQKSVCEQVFDEKTVDLKAPVRGIVSVISYDDENAPTTLSEGVDYYFKKTSNFGLKISLETAPTNYVVIRYVAGFGTYSAGSGEVAINEGDLTAYPQVITALLLLTNHFYENRGTTTDFQKYDIPGGLERLIHPIKKYT